MWDILCKITETMWMLHWKDFCSVVQLAQIFPAGDQFTLQ